jgi:hypothetical protein
MKRFRERKSWVVLIAVLLLLLAACKGETPTAPPPGGGGTPGGTTPPTGVSLTLTTTNSSPLVDSSVTITATATLNNTPVPNGTAVEFTSTGGSLNGNGTAILRTTTNGISTVTLTATTTGLVRVSATVNNVTRTIDITFVARPVIDPPITSTPTISSITPSIGRPSGGQVIRIVGTNFKSLVRVLFDTGGPLPVEGSVQFVSDTLIEVITPPVNLGSGQQLPVDVIVLTQAGSATEQRVELANGFTYRNEQLTPIIHTVTPNSGPVTGGTRVTILGEAFQEPVQVLFNTAEARILNVTYGQILVETPAARDTDPNGSGTITGPVTVLVRNINSNTTGTMTSGFLYKAAMQITAAGPGSGLYTGGTRVSIDGIGFLAPVTVSVAGFPAQVLSVTGTKVIIITPAVPITGCAEVSGPIAVTNVANGDAATGPTFNFLVPPPFITNVSPSVVTVGVDTQVTVTVTNAQVGVNRIRIGDKTVFPTSVTIDPVTGIGTFIVPLPTNFVFPTETCGVGGTRQVPLDVDVTYQNANTGCTDTAADALTVNPPSSTCVLPPSPDINVSSPVPPTCLFIQAPDATTPASGNITVQNLGNAALTVTATATPGPTFTVLPPNTSIPPSGSQIFVVTYSPGGVGTNVNGNVAFTSNDPDEPTVNVCITGDPTP